MQGGRSVPIPFDDILDPKTGRTKVRLVNIKSESYRVALDYMIRLEPSDFENEEMLAKLAAEAMSPDKFRRKYGHVTTLWERIKGGTNSLPGDTTG
jgi:6-phosphofructokinase 1